MGRIKYLLFAIFNLNLSEMFKTIKMVSKKSDKGMLFVFIDMVFCGFKYQAGYHDYIQSEFYTLNSKERKTIITRGINNQIIKKFNDKSEWYKFEDKVQFHKLFKKFMKRDFMVLDNNLLEFEQFLKKHSYVIIKPITGDGGRGIRKVVYDDTLKIEKLYEELIENKLLLIEEGIIQHNKINKLYNGSVNTIRIFTFQDDDKFHFLRAIFKIGNGAVVDNYASKGMFTVLDEKGRVLYAAIDKKGNVYKEHPITKKKIESFQIPFFKEAIKMVEEASRIVPKIRYVGWDVAIGKNGPLIVEGNCYPGIFQMKPSVKKTKIGDLEKFQRIMKF